MPAASAEWKPITAELGGLIDITREYGLPLDRPKRSMAWIKTTIDSDKAQTIHTSYGMGARGVGVCEWEAGLCG